jgi:predicted dehydrogenase
MTIGAIRIGIVGAGSTTRAVHIPRFQALDGVEVVAVANRSRRSGQRVADRLRIPKVYDSWVDLVAAQDIDAVCIGTWPYMHRTLVIAALEHGKHVLTEARMAMNAQEAREMLDASRRQHHLVAQVVPASPTFKVDVTINELLAEGYLGDLLSVDLVAQEGFMDLDRRYSWRHDSSLSGYNTMMLGFWYECLMRWLGHAVSVTAITRINVSTRYDDAAAAHVVTLPDHVEVLCEMASGPVMHMRHSAVTGLAPPVQVWLFGTDGTLRLIVDEDAGIVSLYGGRRGDRNLTEIEIASEKQGIWRVEEEFVNAIRGTELVSLTTFEDGVKYMELTEAVARSAQSRKTVYLPL